MTQDKQAAIAALLKRWAAREYGQDAGFLSASEVVDIVLAALSQGKRQAGHDGPCAAVALEAVSKEWCANYPGNSAYMINQLAAQIDAHRASQPVAAEGVTIRQLRKALDLAERYVALQNAPWSHMVQEDDLKEVRATLSGSAESKGDAS